METMVVVHDARRKLDEEMLATRGNSKRDGGQCDQHNRTQNADAEQQSDVDVDNRKRVGRGKRWGGKCAIAKAS